MLRMSLLPCPRSYVIFGQIISFWKIQVHTCSLERFKILVAKFLAHSPYTRHNLACGWSGFITICSSGLQQAVLGPGPGVYHRVESGEAISAVLSEHVCTAALAFPRVPLMSNVHVRASHSACIKPRNEIVDRPLSPTLCSLPLLKYLSSLRFGMVAGSCSLLHCQGSWRLNGSKSVGHAQVGRACPKEHQGNSSWAFNDTCWVNPESIGEGVNAVRVEVGWGKEPWRR